MKVIKMILTTVFLVCPSIALGLICIYQLFMFTYLFITHLEYFVINTEVSFHYVLLSLGLLSISEVLMDKADKIITDKEDK